MKLLTLGDMTTKRKALLGFLLLFVLIALMGMNFYNFYTQEQAKFKERNKENNEKRVITSDSSLLNVDQVAALENQITKVQEIAESVALTIKTQNDEILQKLQEQDTKGNELTEKISNVETKFNSNIEETQKEIELAKDLTRSKSVELENKLKDISVKTSNNEIKNFKLPPLKALTNESDTNENNLKDELSTLLNKTPSVPPINVEPKRLDLFTPNSIDNAPQAKSFTTSKDSNKLVNSLNDSKEDDNKKTDSSTPTTNNENGSTSNDQGGKKGKYELTLGFTKAISLMGVDAPTTSKGESNPYPVLFHVDGSIINANGSSQSINKCFILTTATGDIRTERANFRLSKLSCITSDGKRRIEANIEGWVIGEDGKPGLAGVVVTKSGQIITKALAAGFLQGVANAFSKAPSFVSTNNGYATASQSSIYSVNGSVSETPATSFSEGFAQGTSDVFGKLADYYIDMIKDLYPVIEVKGGRKVTILLKGGESLSDVPFNKLFIGSTFETILNDESNQVDMPKIQKRIN